MVAKPKVLITGASGLIGSLVIRDLSDKYDFSGLSRRPVAGIVHTQADITDPAAMRKAAAGMDMVLHLAAENPFHHLHGFFIGNAHTLNKGAGLPNLFECLINLRSTTVNNYGVHAN